jgi:hypothetical protein
MFPSETSRHIHWPGDLWPAGYQFCRWYLGLDPSEGYRVCKETEIYSIVDGHGIAPRFLGHLTENHHGRSIGLLVEHIPSRIATLGDLTACRDALAKLHDFGIALGSLDAESLLFTGQTDSDGKNRVVMHNCGGAYPTDDKDILNAEMISVEEVLPLAMQNFGSYNLEVMV